MFPQNLISPMKFRKAYRKIDRNSRRIEEGRQIKYENRVAYNYDSHYPIIVQNIELSGLSFWDDCTIIVTYEERQNKRAEYLVKRNGVVVYRSIRQDLAHKQFEKIILKIF